MRRFLLCYIGGAGVDSFFGGVLGNICRRIIALSRSLNIKAYDDNCVFEP